MIWDAEGAEAVAVVRAWLRSGRWNEATRVRPAPNADTSVGQHQLTMLPLPPDNSCPHPHNPIRVLIRMNAVVIDSAFIDSSRTTILGGTANHVRSAYER
jgi:hypothetical protein